MKDLLLMGDGGIVVILNHYKDNLQSFIFHQAITMF